ncbi:ATP-binding protein [Rubrivivax gelatinosus]|uniref:histidine kinase n=2 Tax=Rubrivivax gelatinosus TaxID=28068 RepID=I0HU31_RUBGI|nr:ATP-binding protein [Rubrivivax gelatinosus]BAL96518.1 sensor protein [Rubrivivax gelatinosus IL144]
MLATRLVLVVLLVELLVAAAVALGLWTLRRQTLDAEQRHLSSLAGAMAAQAEATLDAAGAALMATRDELAEGLLTPGTRSADALLRARIAALPRFRSLVVVDRGGQVLADSDVDRPTLSPQQREALAAVGTAPPGRLYLGRADAGEGVVPPAIAVATDWRDGQRRLRGAVLLMADAEFLDRDFPQLAPTADTRLGLYRREDLSPLADGPGALGGEPVPAADLAGLWSGHPGDAATRLVASRQLDGGRLLLVVSRDRDRALAAWSGQAALAAAFVGLAFGVTLMLALRSAREGALRRAAEARMAAEQGRALRAFQAAQEGAWEWNPAGGRTYLSPRMKELLGLARDAPAEGALYDHPTLHPDDVEPLRQAFLAHQRGQTGQFDQVFRVRRPDGSWRHVRSRGLALQGEEGIVFCGSAADVSEDVRSREQRRQLEEQLARASRLEALGTLAGGVAHDFNNILAAVVGYGELARGEAREGSAQARRLDQVLQAGQRGKALVERVLAFSRATPRPAQAVAVQAVVEEVLDLLGGSLAPGLQIRRRLQAPRAAVRIDATAFFEAVMNLGSNGLQAMPGGGCLTVTLEELRLDVERSVFEGRVGPGRHLRLRVVDEGPGVAAEVLPRLFEPFFTTKTGQGPGGPRGTGLGLSVVHGVVFGAGGAIDVGAGESGRGARFDLYLPLCEEAAAPAAAADAPVAEGRGEAVLVVDDEPALVELAEDLLAGLGYEPFGCTDAAVAMERLREAPQRFDLLLTDERMPAVSGTALAAAARTLRPDLPVVLASGWGGPELERRAAQAGVAVVVAKPLTRAELAAALARALGR